MAAWMMRCFFSMGGGQLVGGVARSTCDGVVVDDIMHIADAALVAGAGDFPRDGAVVEVVEAEGEDEGAPCNELRRVGISATSKFWTRQRRMALAP